MNTKLCKIHYRLHSKHFSQLYNCRPKIYFFLGKRRTSKTWYIFTLLDLTGQNSSIIKKKESAPVTRVSSWCTCKNINPAQLHMDRQQQMLRLSRSTLMIPLDPDRKGRKLKVRSLIHPRRLCWRRPHIRADVARWFGVTDPSSRNRLDKGKSARGSSWLPHGLASRRRRESLLNKRQHRVQIGGSVSWTSQFTTRRL